MTTTTMTERIAFVGLGAMGRPMLNRMVAARGPDLIRAYDIDASVAERISRDSGVARCASLRDVASHADVIFTCLPNNVTVLETFLGKQGLGEYLKPNSVSIDCSTVGPEISREIAEHLGSRGIDHLDASMLGSVKQATEGTISFVIGGREEALERIRPLLAHLGGMIRYCGPSGSGNAMKLLHQILVATHAVAASEAIAACEKLGVAPRALHDVVVQGTGLAHSRYFELRIPRAMEGEFSPLFMLRLMAKDAGLARDMLAETPNDGALSMLDAAIGNFEAGIEAGLGDEDFSAVLKIARKRFFGVLQ